MAGARTKLLIGDRSLDKLYYEMSSYTCSYVLAVFDDKHELRRVRSILSRKRAGRGLNIKYMLTERPEDIEAAAGKIREAAEAHSCNALLVNGSVMLINSCKLACRMLIGGKAFDNGELLRKNNFYPLYVVPTKINNYRLLDNFMLLKEGGDYRVISGRELCPEGIIIDRRVQAKSSQQRVSFGYLLARAAVMIETAETLEKPIAIAAVNYLKKLNINKSLMPQENLTYRLNEIAAMISLINGKEDKLLSEVIIMAKRNNLPVKALYISKAEAFLKSGACDNLRMYDYALEMKADEIIGILAGINEEIAKKEIM